MATIEHCLAKRRAPKRARNWRGKGSLLGLISSGLTVLLAVAGAFAPVALDASPALAGEGAAFDTVRRMGRGVNVLGYDGIWDGGTDAPFKERNFKRIRDAGFGHVRINVFGFKYMNDDYVIQPFVLERLDWVLQKTTEAGLIPIIDQHQVDECQPWPWPRTCGKKLMAFWTQVSERYAGKYPTAIFEILNEPGGRMTHGWWNDFIADVLAVIRKTNPDRQVIVAALNVDGPDALYGLKVPADDPNIILTAHYYRPMEFTHQAAAWGAFPDKRDVPWGDEEDKRGVESDLAVINEWAQKMNRPVLLGEFGVYDLAPMDSRARYLSFVARTAEKYGWAWAYWQFDHDFALFDTNKDDWIYPVLNALIPQSGVKTGQN